MMNRIEGENCTIFEESKVEFRLQYRDKKTFEVQLPDKDKSDERCDVFIKCTSAIKLEELSNIKEIFVELKATMKKKAVNQLRKSIIALSEVHSTERIVYIVYCKEFKNNYPKADTQMQTAKYKFNKDTQKTKLREIKTPLIITI